MSRPLPDPEGLEEARQQEIRRSWLYRLGLIVVGGAFYVNLMLGLVGTAIAASAARLGWGWAALASAVLVALPIVGFGFLQRWRERHHAEAHQAVLDLLELKPRPRWLRVGLVLLIVVGLTGLFGAFTTYDPRMAWSLILGAQLIAIPLRFSRLGRSWGWAAYMVIWVGLSIALIQLTYPWTGEPGLMWVGLGTLLLSPVMLVNVLLAKQVVAASIATPGHGLGRLEPLLAFHHLAEVRFERGGIEELEPWMRQVVSIRPRIETTFVLLGRVLAGRSDPAEQDYWVLGTELLPASPEVFARLAECVEDAELALAYARFAESNALRRPTGLDTERFTSLVVRLEQTARMEAWSQG